MDVSTKCIAAKLKISRSTVSFILNDRWRMHRISKATHDRVMRHVQAVRFRPNRLAISLKTKRTHSVAVIVPLIMGSFYQEILNGAESVLGQRYNLQLGISGYDPAKETRLLEAFLERRVDGLLYVGTGQRTNDALIEEWLAKKIPVVLLDRRTPGLHTHFVASDNAAIGELATNHLIESGMREIHFLGPRMVSCNVERVRGYRRALAAHHLRPQETLLAQLKRCSISPRFQAEWAGYNGLQEILRWSQPPFGIFANDLAVAAGVTRAAKEAGLSIPHDIAVCGVDAPQFADLHEIPPTYVRQQTEAIGAKAAEILIAQIENPEARIEPQTVLLPGEFVQGKSTKTPGVF